MTEKAARKRIKRSNKFRQSSQLPNRLTEVDELLLVQDYSSYMTYPFNRDQALETDNYKRIRNYFESKPQKSAKKSTENSSTVNRRVMHEPDFPTIHEIFLNATITGTEPQANSVTGSRFSLKRV